VQASSITTHRRYKIVRGTILNKARSPKTEANARLDFDFPGKIPMNIHDKAPDFTLQDENGKEVALKDLRGKTVILFFYPRANTPG
jgi:cytochrome oxidase Cu insertion factor (SCO1/SenC/PrrC family)